MNAFEKILLASQEFRMEKGILIIRFSRLVKAIHVKLSDERSVIAMLEMKWKDFLGEFVWIFYAEFSSTAVP